MDKKTAAALLEELGVLLEIKGESVFKTLAYTKAARALLAQPGELEEIIRETDLKGIKGIGESIRLKIIEINETGRLHYLEKIKDSIPAGLIQMMRVPGLGPRKAKAIYDELGVASIGELLYACNENRLVNLPGFGQKTQEKIIQGIALLEKHSDQYLFSFAEAEALKLLWPIRKSGKAVRAAIAGSIRRKKEVVKDIDIIASSDAPASLMEVFCGGPEVETVVAKGDTKSSVTLKSGIAADLRVVEDWQYPYALHHFTGSALHNTRMRGRAKRMDMKMNEYGLFKGEKEELVPCKSEEEIFRALGLDYIPPEIREDAGEVEAAESGGLPMLIEEGDIKGIFHVHSRYSDGKDEISELAEAARRRGYQYIGITDHSKTAAYAGGLRPEDLVKQQSDIDACSKMYDGFHIFKGAEVDILPDGSLDYEEEILKGFDFTVCSIHSKFKMTEEEATARVIKAIESPYCTILGHPTGRLLLSREGYPLNMRKVIEAAAANGVAIELNAHPQRLDIDWREMRYAKELGVKIAISPDAHNLGGFEDMRYGLGIARKGWLEKGDVLNALDLEQIKDYIEKRKKSRLL